MIEQRFFRIYLPFLLVFFTTIAVTPAIRGEPFRLFPWTSGPSDAIYVRILVPLATMFNPNFCLCAVIWAFALEAITVCRCIRLLWLFWIRAWPGTGTARGARVTALSSRAMFHISLIMYERIIYTEIASWSTLILNYYLCWWRNHLKIEVEYLRAENYQAFIKNYFLSSLKTCLVYL